MNSLKKRELRLSVAHVKRWYRSMRDQCTKFDGKSGDGNEEWAERQRWIIGNFQYLKKFAKHRSRSLKSVKTIILEKGDLEAAEVAAALQGLGFDAEQPGISQQQSTPAKKSAKKTAEESESESVASLDEKVKGESSRILSFLKSQMLPP